jgi:uncharacterized protein YkwD
MSTTGRLKKAAIATVAAGILAGMFAPAAQAGIHDRGEMKRLTNVSRWNHDIRGVNLDLEISKLARRHSLKMARTGDLFHTSNPSSYYLKGRSWNYWGENVGVTGGTAKDLHKAFMASLGHRHNILNRTFTKVAIGAVRRDGALWVTVFFYG